MAALQYETLFKSLDTAYIVFGVDDPTFTILEENDAHAEIANANRSTTIGRPLFDVFPDVSAEYTSTGHSRLLESIRTVIATKKPDTLPNLHYDIKDKHGNMQTRYWIVSHHPVIEKGKVVAVYQVTSDITEDTLAQQRLVTTQYQLEQVLKIGSVCTWTWDITNQTISGDTNLANLFGLDAKKVAKGLPADVYAKSVHPDDRERVTKEFNDAVTKLRPYECEYRTLAADGEVHWIVARGYFDSSDKDAVQSPGVIVDITDRKRAEENLMFLTDASTQFAAELGYKKVLSNIAQFVVPKVADWFSIELVEDGYLRQVVLTHRDPSKVKWAEALRRKQGDPHISDPGASQQVLSTGEVLYYPEITQEMLEAAAKDEEELRIINEIGFSSLIIAPMTLDNKTIGVLTLVATESRVHYKPADVEVAKTLANRAAMAVYNATLYTNAKQELKERRLLQKDLELLNDKLEVRVDERTKELRATNKGLEQEVRKRRHAEKELEVYSKELTRSNQELQDFAYVASHDLQEPLRKIQAFGGVLVSEYADKLGLEGQEYLERMRSAASRMSILIEDLLAFSRVTTQSRPYQELNLTRIAADVVEDLDARIKETKGTVKIGELPTVWADETHMRQLLQNLIGNALKFHQPDVPPIVTVSMKPLKKSDSMYTVNVTDNGIGFDEKYLDRIFAVFQRLHGKSEHEGTGIGLAVCRKITERYGGTITAASKKGSGSTFTFTIPVGRGQENE